MRERAGLRKLIEAAPRLDGSTPPPLESGEVVLEANDVSVSFQERDARQPLHAVQDLDLLLEEIAEPFTGTRYFAPQSRGRDKGSSDA